MCGSGIDGVCTTRRDGGGAGNSIRLAGVTLRRVVPRFWFTRSGLCFPPSLFPEAAHHAVASLLPNLGRPSFPCPASPYPTPPHISFKVSTMGAPRRSRRLQAQKQQAKHHAIAKGGNHSSYSVSSVDLDVLEAKLRNQRQKLKARTTRNYQTISDFVDDSASSSNCPTDSETSASDNYDEKEGLTSDFFEHYAADAIDVDRKLSYDSRCESGNEDYEADGFVVGDGDELEEASSSAEADVSDVGSLDRVRCDSFATAQYQRTGSGESKLFYSGPEDPPDLLALWPLSDFGSCPGSPLEDSEALILEASEEVVEEIFDALSLFARRCNRHREPLTLRLASAVLRDDGVREALESAVRRGLGRKLSLADGSKRWTIGPK